jgi:hypothetical protein
VRRELRHRADGKGWTGVAILNDGALVPQTLLPGIDSQLRLRFLTDTGASFLGLPDNGGWRLQASVGHNSSMLHLAPDEAVVLSAHADGRLLADMVLDAGLPPPDEAPLLWRATDPEAANPEALVPLTGGGRTRGNSVWLLVPDGAIPECEPGISVGSPVAGPGGKLWPLSGSGAINVCDEHLTIATGSETDEAEARLMAVGKLLPGWKPQAGITVFVGEPVLWGAHGEAPLRSLKERVLTTKPVRLLGGRLIEWHENGETLARLRIGVLPDGFRPTLRESGAGILSLDANGLEPGWHAALLSGANEARCSADADGKAVLQLTVAGQLPGSVILRLSDPESGTTLALEALWPARSGLILDPNGERLENNRALAIGSLNGWRGILPPSGGSVQMRIAGHGTAVGFQSAGKTHLAALEPLARQVLAFAGPDKRLHLRLIAGGRESSRLELGRYDWAADTADNICNLGAGRVNLSALTLRGPLQVFETEAAETILLSQWLGDKTGLYFVQGHSATRGIMRPFVWSTDPLPPSTRDDRIARYKNEWCRLLKTPDDPGWKHQWDLICAARKGGDAGALDQVQALGLVPAAAVVLMLRTPRAKLAEAVALEEAAPLSWPMLPCTAWREGVRVALAWQMMRHEGIGFSSDEAANEAAKNLANQAGRILMLRPNLKVHLGQAYHAAGLSPLAVDANGAQIPLFIPKPRAELDNLAQQAARRFGALPNGVGHVKALHLHLGAGLTPELHPLLDAPLAVAEASASLRETPKLDEILQLFSLRQADPTWFDAAIPPALSLALEVRK